MTGPVDILISNAGMGSIKHLPSMGF